MYKSLIRSRLDYRAPIYNLANKSSLLLLDTIQTSSLRLALGAFRTSPKLSLCAEAAEPPLSYRRLILTSNFLSTVSQFPQLPIYNPIFLTETTPPSIPNNKHIRHHFELALQKSFKAHPLQPIYTLSPPWTFTPPSIRLDLTQLSAPKNIIYLQHIRSLIQEYPHHTLCLSDGSKSKTETAYAYSINGNIISHRIHNIASIHTAELMAIFACISQISQLPPNNNFLLLTDSLTSLHSLTDPYSTNPLVQRIHLTLLTLNSINSNITFVWIPGHIGLPEHDAVDRAAKQALLFSQLTDNTPAPVSDYKNHYRSLILQSWYTFWKNQQYNKLLPIKQTPTPWMSSLRDSRREEVILTRLRIGHTRITHSHLLNPESPTPSSCPHCHQQNLTAAHIFSCPQLQSLRTSLKIPSSIARALRNNSHTVSLALQYLRLSHFYSSI